MRVAVLGMSGNTGKTTFSQMIRRQEDKVISVEKINSTTFSGGGVRGSDADAIIMAFMLNDDVVADIGASEYERFINMLKSNDGAINDVDRWVLPVVPKDKQKTDVLNSIKHLLELGVDHRKIKVVFNMINEEMFENDFNGFIGVLNKVNVKTKPSCAIPESEVFKKLEQSGFSFNKASTDNTDYRKLARSSKDTAQAKKNVLLSVMCGQARALRKTFNEVDSYVRS